MSLKLYKPLEWLDFMKEFQKIVLNNTWELVPTPLGPKIIGNKYVFRVELKAKKSLERYKIRVVTKGYDQTLSIDYTHTFSYVVMPSTIKLVLTFSLSKGWIVSQLDVNNVFLKVTYMMFK